MLMVISDCVKLWSATDVAKACLDKTLLRAGQIYVCVKDRWFRTLTANKLAQRRKSSKDKYHYLYIQLNLSSGEYYIGKANRARWSEVKRYQGSGIRFRSAFAKHKELFVRFFLAAFDTQEETERLESKLVDEELLRDKLCLNLVVGGGGVARNYRDEAARIAKIRAYNKAHPEHHIAMLAKAKELYHSELTEARQQRSRWIKDTMSAEKYREMTRERIKRWREEHPEEYEKARLKNKLSLDSEDVKQRRNNSLKLWKQLHPVEAEEWVNRLRTAQQSQSARAKRKASLKKWRDTHPDEYARRVKNMVEKGNAKRMKAVCRLDVASGAILETYACQHDAARWLVREGLAKNANCVASISDICRNEAGMGRTRNRKMAYGYGWKFLARTEQTASSKYENQKQP